MQDTAAWAIGAAGERRVAEVLASCAGVHVLHDRRIPGSRANIDHIAVAPHGVYVIDAKQYEGAVEAREVGGWLRSDVRLYVNGRDRTKLVEACPARSRLFGSPSTPRRPQYPSTRSSASSAHPGRGSAADRWRSEA